MRRMNYLSAQVYIPSKEAFIKLEEEYLNMIGEKVNIRIICQMIIIHFMKHIKAKFNELQDIQKKHFKVKDIHHSRLNVQEYL